MKGEWLASDFSDIYVPREIPITSLQDGRGCCRLVVLAFVFCISVLAQTPLVLHSRTLYLHLNITNYTQENLPWKPYIHWASHDVCGVRRVLRRIYGHTRNETARGCRKRLLRSFTIWTTGQILQVHIIDEDEHILRVGGIQKFGGKVWRKDFATMGRWY
jgi:hypothetical protein